MHPRQYYGVLLLITAAVIVLVLAAIMVRKQLEDAREIFRSRVEQPSSTE
jgi:hypothetical protein